MSDFAEANEFGVFDPAQGETLSFQNSGVSLEIYLVRTGAAAWRWGAEVDLHSGVYRGAGHWPGSHDAPQRDRESALEAARRWVLGYLSSGIGDSHTGRLVLRQATAAAKWLDSLAKAPVEQLGLFS